jgi:hypothetical protein
LIKQCQQIYGHLLSFAGWVDDQLGTLRNIAYTTMTITSVTISHNHNNSGLSYIFITGSPAEVGNNYGNAYYIYNPNDDSQVSALKIFMAELISARDSGRSVRFIKGTSTYQVIGIMD